MTKRFLVLTSLLIGFSSPSFAGVNDDIEDRGQYWQRVSASSQLYVQGPKAQQLLNRNIAHCVVELRELERLGAVRDAIPEYVDGIVLDDVEARLAGWDSPERDKELFAEHSDYIDFEGCMRAKGWERVKYVPFEVAERSQENYKRTHTKYRKDSKKLKLKSDRTGQYDHLNR